jgi:hypothetical protein
MVLDRGRTTFVGDPEDAVAVLYDELTETTDGAIGPRRTEDIRWERGSATIEEALIVDASGSPRATFGPDETATLRMRVRFGRDVGGPLLGVAVFAGDEPLYSHSSIDEQLGHFSEGDVAVFEADFATALQPGAYRVQAAVHGPDVVTGFDRTPFLDLAVDGSRTAAGVGRLETSVRVTSMSESP